MVKRNVLNKLWLLKLIDDSGDINVAIDIDLQDFIFCTQKLLNKKQIPALNYKFVNWLNGPLSTELKDDLEFLREKKFIEKHENNRFKITNNGETLVKKIDKLYENITYDDSTSIINTLLSKFEEDKKSSSYTKSFLEYYRLGDIC